MYVVVRRNGTVVAHVINKDAVLFGHALHVDGHLAALAHDGAVARNVRRAIERVAIEGMGVVR